MSEAVEKTIQKPAEKPAEKPIEKVEPKTKTAAEAKAIYDKLAAEVTATSAKRPKIELEIRRKVIEAMGDFDKKFAELRARKLAASLEWQAADAAEAPERLKREQDEAAAKEKQAVDSKKDENAARKKVQDAELVKNLREAATK